MAISLDQVFSIHDDALALRSRRSSILASNIANADTPNYKAQDIDFKSMLREVGGRSNQIRLAQTHERHYSPDSNGSSMELMFRNPLHASLDGNTVDSHVEQAQFSENAIQYQASFTLLNGKIRGLIKALKGE
jgi:flagellar basal-body rod protein FlgB